MTTPSITQGQFAIDPSTGSLYYKNAVGTLVQSSLSWQHVSNTAIATDDSITVAGSMVIAGNLTVNGTTVTLNTETTVIEDNIILLNSGVTAGPTLNAGIEVERGTSDNVSILWNETTGKWTFTNNGSAYYDFISAASNITGTAAAWTTARTITLAGDLTGSVSIDGSANTTLTATIAANSVALGTDTTGSYVSSLVAGTGVTLSNNTGETATPTIAVDVSVMQVRVANVSDTEIGYLDGVTSALQAQIDAKQATVANVSDTEIGYLDGVTSALQTQINAKAPSNGATLINATLSGTVTGNVTGNVTGDVTGNADTATKLATARTIALTGPVTGSVSFDGSANISIATSLTAESSGIASLSDVAITSAASGDFLRYNGSQWINDPVDLATDTVGSYVQSLTAGSNILISNNAGEGTTPTIAVSATPNYTTVTASNLIVDGIEIDTTGAVGGQVLKYDASTGKFIPSQDNVASAGNLAITDMTDVVFNNVQNHDYLKYSSVSSKWVNSPVTVSMAVDDLSDVVITSAASNQFLRYSGSTWENQVITLGTNTTGNYMSGLTQGTGVTITHTPGEGSSATIEIGQSVAAGDSPTFAGLTINGGLIVNGSSIVLEGATANDFETTISVTDPTADRTVTFPDATGTVALVSDLTTHTNLTQAHGATGEVVGTTNTQTLTNKTLTSPAISTPTGIVKGDVGLGSVDDTADTAKPISTAQQTALDLKANLASPTFTGTLSAADITLSGNLTVNGTTTTINSTTISVDDKNIELGSISSPTDISADGGGITLKGDTDKTINWVSSTSSWTSSEHLSLSSGKSIKLNGATSGTITLSSASIAGTNTITLPATTGTIVTTGDTGTVTATMLATGPARSGFRSEINAQTGTSYTLVLGDLGKLVTMDNAAGMTLAVPPDASVVFAVGDKIDILRKGAGALTIAGIGINGTPGLKLRAQWSSATLVKLATDTWVLIGDLAA